MEFIHLRKSPPPDTAVVTTQRAAPRIHLRRPTRRSWCREAGAEELALRSRSRAQPQGQREDDRDGDRPSPVINVSDAAADGPQIFLRKYQAARGRERRDSTAPDVRLTVSRRPDDSRAPSGAAYVIRRLAPKTLSSVVSSVAAIPIDRSLTNLHPIKVILNGDSRVCKQSWTRKVWGTDHRSPDLGSLPRVVWH